MDKPECAIDYYMLNTTKPPMDDVRVRKAFNMAIDKVGLAAYQRTIKPLTAFSPEGIFPGYPQPVGDPFDPLAREASCSPRRLSRCQRQFRSGEVSDCRGRAHLQHDRAQSPDRRIRAGAVEAEPRPDGAAQEHGVEDVPRLPRQARIQGRRADRVGRRLHGSVHVPRSVHDEDRRQRHRLVASGIRRRCCARPTAQQDPKKRYELLAKAEKMLLDAQPVIPLATSSTNWMKKPYVKGMYPNPVTMHAWKFVYIEHDPAKWSTHP